MKRDLWLAAAATLLVATALTSMHRVFTTHEWRAETLLALLVAAVVATTARLVRLPALAALVVSAAGLLLYATVVFVPDAGPLPGPEAMRQLWALYQDGLVQTRLQPAPSAPLDSLRLLVVLGVWPIAHLTHEALVRLRRPGIALVPAGLLWLVPLAVPQAPGATWPYVVPFLLAAGIVLLLEPNLDLAGWTQEDDRPRLPRVGLAATAVATLVAVLMPGVLPGYGDEPWLDVSTTVEPRGYQPIVDVGDRLHLPEPRDVLLVETTRPLYLRLAALETFDGRTWRLGPPGVETYRPDPSDLFRTDGPLPFETSILSGTRVEASVRVLDLENIYVPVPYQIERIEGPEDASLFYSRDGGFVATGDTEENELSGRGVTGVREGFEYDLEAVIPTPSYADLAGLGDVSLPADDPRVALPAEYDDIRAQAAAIVADAGAQTAVDRVLAVQDHFIGPDSEFVYSTDVPRLQGDSALHDFLFESRTGYCEYYATGMAVMLRSMGIPARVAVGFLPGRLLVPANAEGGEATFIVSTTDAHAWVEVFFPEFGWVKFDPTPRADGSTLPPTDDDLDPTRSLVRDAVTPSESASPSADVPSATDLPSLDPADPSTTTDPASRPGWPWLIVIALPIAGLAVLAARRTEPERDPVTAVLLAQRRVLRAADRLGIGRRPAETTTEVTARWSREGRITADDAQAFGELAATAAFAGTAPPDGAERARALEERIVTGLRGSVTARERITAPMADLARRTRDRLRRSLPRRTRT